MKGWPVFASVAALALGACGGGVGVDAGDVAAEPDGPPPDPSPYKGPWVERVDTTRASVRWESRLEPPNVAVTLTPAAGGAPATLTGAARPADVTTGFGVGLPIVREPDVPGVYFMDEVDLAGLTPATCYDYFVTDYPTATGSFCTMHDPADRSTLIRFMAIGDTNPVRALTVPVLDQILPRGPEFVVHEGDVQYYSSIVESWRTWMELMAPMLRAAPMYAAPGNHEYELGGDEFAQYYGRFWDRPAFDGTNETYHFETGGVHFIALDTEHLLTAGSPQYAWLSAKLDEVAAAPGYRFTIVYFHRPIDTVGDYSPNLDNRTALEPLFTSHVVPLVLQGHMHGYERFEVGAITYVTTAGGGGIIGNVDANVTTYPADAAMRVASGPYYHAMWFTIDATTLHGEAVDGTGAVLDTFDKPVP